jgi:hypothetical protein
MVTEPVNSQPGLEDAPPVESGVCATPSKGATVRQSAIMIIQTGEDAEDEGISKGEIQLAER